MSASALQAMIRLKLAYAKQPSDENLSKQRHLADQLTHEEAVYVVQQYESAEYYQKQARNGPSLAQEIASWPNIADVDAARLLNTYPWLAH